MTTRRHLIASLTVAAAMALAGLSGAACSADATAQQTSVDSPQASGGTTTEETAGTGFFDDSTVHTIGVTFDQDDYDDMVLAYTADNEKDWIEATVTIDGTTFENVGMRLKGNSSLRGLTNGREMGPGGAVSADEPQGLPWLIRLDKFIDGQNYDGVSDLVIRSSNWQTALNEAVALDLLDEAGLASQRSVYVRFTVNDEETRLRLCVELPDDVWMAQTLSSDGALYKAEATGNYGYRGTDPEAYDEIFDQEAGKDNADLTPLIEFLDFINNADDATFESTIAEKLDLDSFATYLAMEDLIANNDDIDGPGNNSYLYFDPSDGGFTVVPWDHNLAFGGMGGGDGVRPDRVTQNAPGGALPNAQGGVAPGQVVPEQTAPDQAAGDDARGPRNKTNILVERLKNDADFQALYQQRLTELRAELYESGVASGILDSWVQLLKTQASDLVDPTTVSAEAARIAAYFTSAD